MPQIVALRVPKIKPKSRGAADKNVGSSFEQAVGLPAGSASGMMRITRPMASDSTPRAATPRENSAKFRINLAHSFFTRPKQPTTKHLT